MEEEIFSRWSISEAYFAAFFCLAQRFFCATEIRLLASGPSVAVCQVVSRGK
jgi:hypothetical protein